MKGERFMSEHETVRAGTIHGETERWLRFADEDLRTAIICLADAEVPARHSCFLAQQAAEKAMKAGLIFCGIEYPRSHDLEHLLTLLPREWHIQGTLLDLSVLTEWLVEGRYPGNWPDPTSEEANIAIEIATAVQVCAWIFGRLNAERKSATESKVLPADAFIKRPDPVSALLARPTVEIGATLRAFVRESPAFEEWLAARVAVTVAPAITSPPPDAAEAARFKRALQSLLRSSAYDGRYSGNITGPLHELMDEAVAHAHGGDGRNGLEQLVLLAEASAEAFEVMDDSDGDLGDFVFELGEELAAAVAMLELSESERRLLAKRLEHPGEEVASYGADGGFDDAVLVLLSGIPGGADDLSDDTRARLLEARLHGLERAGEEEVPAQTGAHGRSSHIFHRRGRKSRHGRPIHGAKPDRL